MGSSTILWALRPVVKYHLRRGVGLIKLLKMVLDPSPPPLPYMRKRKREREQESLIDYQSIRIDADSREFDSQCTDLFSAAAPGIFSWHWWHVGKVSAFLWDRACAGEPRQNRESATHCNTLQHTATHCNTLQQNRESARLLKEKSFIPIGLLCKRALPNRALCLVKIEKAPDFFQKCAPRWNSQRRYDVTLVACRKVSTFPDIVDYFLMIFSFLK